MFKLFISFCFCFLLLCGQNITDADKTAVWNIEQTTGSSLLDDFDDDNTDTACLSPLLFYRSSPLNETYRFVNKTFTVNQLNTALIRAPPQHLS